MRILVCAAADCHEHRPTHEQFSLLDPYDFVAHIMAMKVANIAEFKNHLSEYLNQVQSGEEIQICKRNVPVARLMPIPQGRRNRTVLGCGKGSAKATADLTEPLIPEGEWEMLGE